MRLSSALAIAPLPLALALGTCDRHATGPASTTALDQAEAVITAAGISADVAVLAADSMRGRRTPGPELEQAAGYIEGAFRAAGLRAGGDNGDFRQRYPCTGAVTAPTNVLAMIPGSDPQRAEEWVVVTAHYDHIGVGVPDANGDSIYNGADDNASGTAGLLGVARAFAALAQPPARSVAFVAASGEELGFVGSWYFVEHRPAAMTRVVADINLDMLGRNAADLVWAMGETLSTLGPLVRQEAERRPGLGLTVQPETQLPSAYQASDQLPFAVAGIPAILLHAGSHPDLHKPSDELSRLDTEKAARIARLAFRLAHAVASSASAPAWTATGDSVLPKLNRYRGICGK